MKKSISIAALLAMIFSGAPLSAAEPAPAAIPTTPTVPAPTSPLIDQAEAACKEAASMGYEWRDTAAIIESARQALGKGQQAESDRLASEALLQGRAAVAQAKEMQANWKIMIPQL